MKNQNSLYGYLAVAILGAFFCFMILNSLGWQKPKQIEAKQTIKPVVEKVIPEQNLPKELELVLTPFQAKQLNQFRPAVRDVAYYILLHPEKLRLDKYQLHCGIFSLWVANGDYGFGLDEPTQIKFTPIEYGFFWKIYINFRDNGKLYNWESEAKITVK